MIKTPGEQAIQVDSPKRSIKHEYINKASESSRNQNIYLNKRPKSACIPWRNNRVKINKTRFFNEPLLLKSPRAIKPKNESTENISPQIDNESIKNQENQKEVESPRPKTVKQMILKTKIIKELE